MKGKIYRIKWISKIGWIFGFIFPPIAYLYSSSFDSNQGESTNVVLFLFFLSIGSGIFAINSFFSAIEIRNENQINTLFLVFIFGSGHAVYSSNSIAGIKISP